MGIGSSEFDRSGAEATWLVEHDGIASPLAQYALRRYGSGVAATGMASNAAVPRLLRRRLQDWSVRGCRVHLGTDFVSFGRELDSISQSGAELFYGVDLRFGDHGASWLWYCRAHEWLLQLHHATLESLPEGSELLPGPRWGGRPRWLGAQPPEGLSEELPSGAEAAPAVEHQLAMVFSNADGHPGLLCLPVPQEALECAASLVRRWPELPLLWAGRRWKTTEDFLRLRETALNITDLFLLGLEPDFAMALTPDWTWEKYPRGLGEAAVAEEEAHESQSQVSQQLTSAPS